MSKHVVYFTAFRADRFNDLPVAIQKYLNRFFVEENIEGVPYYVALVTSRYENESHRAMPGVAPFIPSGNFDYKDHVLGLLPESTIHGWIEMKVKDSSFPGLFRFGASLDFVQFRNRSR